MVDWNHFDVYERNLDTVTMNTNFFSSLRLWRSNWCWDTMVHSMFLTSKYWCLSNYFLKPTGDC
jgi:hypothetical protein